MPEPAADRTETLKYLELALAEAQATVRGYDTKAQIIGIGYTFAVNIVANVAAGIPTAEEKSLLLVLIFWGIVMAPLFLFGYVLFPSRRTTPWVDTRSGSPLRRVLYVETARHPSVEDLEAAACASDWLHEMSFEVLMVSRLRELKRARFVRALHATAFSFAVLFAIQIWQAV